MNRPFPHLNDASYAHTSDAARASMADIKSRARRLQDDKNFEAAAHIWQEFIKTCPKDAEAMNELGAIFLHAGQYEQGLDWFRRALRIRPGLLSAKVNMGVALRALNRLDEALSCFKQVVGRIPDDAIACFNVGNTLNLLRLHEQALPWLRKASDRCPSHAESAHELGKALQALKQTEEAIQAFRRAVSLQPHSVESLLSLGGLLQEARRFDEASSLFRKVVELDPAHCNGWLSLGAALLGAKRHAESIAAFRRALGIQPGSAVGYCNMALPLMALGRLEEAIDACRKAICIEPGSPIPNFNMGTMLLTLGKFREGWQAYNYRHAMHGEKWLREEAHAAPWTGEPLAGKSILILGEQGNGDQIQFARYLPELSDRGATVSYLAPARLHRLFRTLRGSITLLSEIPQNALFDFQCPLMTLPGIFEQLRLPIPNAIPYLAAEPERIAKWRSRIGEQGFRVGIVWQGNCYDGDNVRSYPLAALRPLAAIPGVRLISLQKDGGTEQLAGLPADMQVERLDRDFDSGQHGFLDATALFGVMDLVVTCDTSMAHLAGALGRPLWIALNEPPEWRWQRHREDSLWYPTARLFRQKIKGDWDHVFLRMAEALAKVIDEKAPTTIQAPKSPPRVEVSWGELLDKISILEIKAERMTSPAAVANVRREMEHLKLVLASNGPLPEVLDKKRACLRATNEALWELEDAIRACEASQRFDAHFIELARKIYAFNDERAKRKQEINALMNSAFVEEKEYRLVAR